MGLIEILPLLSPSTLALGLAINRGTRSCDKTHLPINNLVHNCCMTSLVYYLHYRLFCILVTPFIFLPIGFTRWYQRTWQYLWMCGGKAVLCTVPLKTPKLFPNHLHFIFTSLSLFTCIFTVESPHPFTSPYIGFCVDAIQMYSWQLYMLVWHLTDIRL